MLRLRVILVGSLSAQEISYAAKVEFFSQKIFPILKENCFKCHGAKVKLKGIRITSCAGLLRGSDIFTFHINQDTGELKPAGHSVKIPFPVCVKLLDLSE